MCGDVLSQSARFKWVSDSVNVIHTYDPLPFYGGGLSVRDFNNDGWDDIALCSHSQTPLSIFINDFGVFSPLNPAIGIPADQNFVVWVDYDNDGYNDCFGVTDTAGVFLLKGDETGEFTDVTNLVGLDSLNGINREGALFADLNNDGLLDLHLSSYTPTEPNLLFLQTPQNTFENISALSGACDSLDFTFFAVAIDYNNDGLFDLYESNDGETRGNLLYRNNGDSTFTEVSQATGTHVLINSMGIGIGDFDGDLDLDMHITGKENETSLLRNNNDGTYSEVAAYHNLDYPEGFGWGSSIFDADLDGDNDVYISGIGLLGSLTAPSMLFTNDGQNNFIEDTLTNDWLYSFSNAIFDFNNDRKPDIVTLNSGGNPSSIWENTTNTNPRRFTLKLRGCNSNRDAAGATIMAYDGADTYLWSVHSSQSFSAQNMDKQIIPILNNEELDSLRITWPAGGDTTLYSINNNQTIELIECGHALPFPVILVDDYLEHHLVLCDDDTIELSVDGTYPNVLWSNGETGSTIQVTTPGTYGVTVTNQFGQTRAANRSVTIEAASNPQYLVAIDEPNCFNNGSIAIIPVDSNNTYNYSWQHGPTDNELFNLTPGNYFVTIDNSGLCEVSEMITLSGPSNLNPITVELQIDTIECNGDSTAVTAMGSGGYGPLSYTWDNGSTGAMLYLFAGTHTVTITDPNGCSEESTFSITEPTELFVWIESVRDTNFSSVGWAWVEIDGGVPPYSIAWNDSLMQSGDTAYSLKAGDYTAVVTDDHGCTYPREFRVRNHSTLGIQDAIASEPFKCSVQMGLIRITPSIPGNIESAELFDIQGKRIRSSYIEMRDDSWFISPPNSGVYMLRINKEATCKVVIL